MSENTTVCRLCKLLIMVINSQDMEERYVLHDYDIEGFDYLPDDSTRMYRKEMLRIFGEKYAADYMLRR